MKEWIFIIEGDDLERVKSWVKNQKDKYSDKTGTIGDRFSYRFTPTSLGTIISVIDSLTNEEIDITDYSKW